jgi:hypothetical protein
LFDDIIDVDNVSSPIVAVFVVVVKQNLVIGDDDGARLIGVIIIMGISRNIIIPHCRFDALIILVHIMRDPILQLGRKGTL